jgi:hypothetical protein
VRGSIGWLKRRNLASSDQSQIGGLPIGVKLEGRLIIHSAILGGGEWRFEAAVPLATHREGELKRGSLEKRSLTRDRWFESFSLQRRVCELSVPLETKRIERFRNAGPYLKSEVKRLGFGVS